MKFKPFEKMSGKEFLHFCLMAICSGVMVGIGALASLSAQALLGDWGKLIGAFLFSLGIFAIVSFDMKLFTGMVADVPTLGIKNCWRLPVCFAFNVIGVMLITGLARYSPVSEIVIEKGGAALGAKLLQEDWALRALCSSILCGILITISVKAKDYAPKKGLSATFGVVLPIVVFAFCGFDHSVANVVYFCYLGQWTWQVLWYTLITMIGNFLGGVMLPSIYSLRMHVMRKKEEK